MMTRLSQKRHRVAAAGIAAAVLLVGCSGGQPREVTPSADDVVADHVVEAIDNAFVPATIEVTVGEAIRWDFVGRMEHDVVAEDGTFVSELKQEGSFTHVFTEPGEYPYKCTIHPEMTGTVVVTE